MVLGGSSAYTYVRMLEMKSTAKEEQHKSSAAGNSSTNLGDEKLTIENAEDESQ